MEERGGEKYGRGEGREVVWGGGVESREWRVGRGRGLNR